MYYAMSAFTARPLCKSSILAHSPTFNFIDTKSKSSLLIFVTPFPCSDKGMQILNNSVDVESLEFVYIKGYKYVSSFCLVLFVTIYTYA